MNRLERDTPLHTVVRWINAEPLINREFGNALVDMMLEAGSSPRIRNKGGLTPLQLVDPANKPLRELIQRHEYAALNAGDFVASADVATAAPTAAGKQGLSSQGQPEAESDDDAEFSGSDEEERAEWERRRKAKRG